MSHSNLIAEVAEALGVPTWAIMAAEPNEQTVAVLYTVDHDEADEEDRQEPARIYKVELQRGVHGVLFSAPIGGAMSMTTASARYSECADPGRF